MTPKGTTCPESIAIGVCADVDDPKFLSLGSLNEIVLGDPLDYFHAYLAIRSFQIRFDRLCFGRTYRVPNFDEEACGAGQVHLGILTADAHVGRRNWAVISGPSRPAVVQDAGEFQQSTADLRHSRPIGRSLSEHLNGSIHNFIEALFAPIQGPVVRDFHLPSNVFVP